MQMESIISSSAEQIAELKAGVAAIREAVTSSVDAFLSGETTGAQLKDQLRQTSGIQLSAAPELLEEMRAAPEGRQEIAEQLAYGIAAEVRRSQPMPVDCGGDFS